MAENGKAAILELTVSAFSERLARRFEHQPEFSQIAIVGEITGWSPYPNGSVYFKLKEGQDALACVAFESASRRFPPGITDGSAVIATGAVRVWAPRSEYQLQVAEIRPTGVGALALQVEALRLRLRAEGLFDDRRKRPIPRFPHWVALVAAPGKGAQDFMTTLVEKAPNVKVTHIQTRVQGVGAEIDIAEAIDRASRLGADAIVVLRGGGSYEDRFPFNTEPVVRAIARTRHPVITAIGHTGDHHLADEVADAVFKTPTAAAEHIVAAWLELSVRLEDAERRIARATARILQQAQQHRDETERRLDEAPRRLLARARQGYLELTNRLDLQNPLLRTEQRATRLARLAQKLDGAGRQALSRAANAFAVMRTGLLANDPLKPLERGYAVVSFQGRVVRDADEVAPGGEIEARLRRGSIAARVERVSRHE